MENIYAVMILHKANKKVNEFSITKVLQAANAKIDKIRIKVLVTLLEDVNIEKITKKIKLPIQLQPVIEVKKEVIEEVEEDKTNEIASGLDRLFD